MMNRQKLAALLAEKAKQGKIPPRQGGMGQNMGQNMGQAQRPMMPPAMPNRLGQSPMSTAHVSMVPNFNAHTSTSNPSLPSMNQSQGIDKFPKVSQAFKGYAAGGEVESDEDPAKAALEADPKAKGKDPEETPDPAKPAAAVAKPKAKAKDSKTSTGGDTASPTHTNTETGGSSPGGASTGGVGSGIGGAGTGGAATGGASTGGAGTVTVTISGSSSTETSSGAGAKKGKGKGDKPGGPVTLNISNVGGTTGRGQVTSGDGPGSSGTGGKGDGSGGGGGGASPDEPENYSTSNKDPKKQFSGINKLMNRKK